MLIAQLMGTRRATPAARQRGDAVGHVRDPATGAWPAHVVQLPLVWETPLRTGNLRDPNGPQSTFAAESFIDELAAAAKADPVEFRLKLLDGRHRPTTRASSARDRSPSSRRRRRRSAGNRVRRRSRANTGRILTGRGIAYAFRGQTVVAEIAEVEVNRDTGRVWVKRLVCAHDCGLVINPEALRRTVEGAMMHALSRALHEEVTFDREKVTSRGLDLQPDADPCRHAGAYRRGDRQRRSEPRTAPICRTTAPARLRASR